MMTLKALLLICLIPVAGVYAAEPQATPTQCLLPAEGGTAKVGKGRFFDVEKCLSKAGNTNFIRSGDLLTVFLANGKEIQFNTKRLENNKTVILESFEYRGYNKNIGVHYIDRQEGIFITRRMIEHSSGADLSKFSDLEFSPGYQWAIRGVSNTVYAEDGSATIEATYCDNLELKMYKLPSSGHLTELVQVPMAGDSSEECRKFIAKQDRYRSVEAIKWLSDSAVKVTWHECVDPSEDGCGKERKDSVVFKLQDGQWIPDRIPFSKRKGTISDLRQLVSQSQPVIASSQKPEVASQAVQANTLRAGMTLEEVEKLLGRSADRFKINPLALLGKQEITRVWTANGRQLEVTFVGGVVASWR